MKKIYFSLGLFFSLLLGYSQSSLSGTVKDKNSEPLAGANIIVVGHSGKGATTDLDGLYSLSLQNGDYELEFSFTGYKTVMKKVTLRNNQTLNVVLQDDDISLDEVVVVGSRVAARSNTDTPLAVDVLPVKEVTNSGQSSLDKALQYRIPSFNTVQTPVNDATSLLDPYEIRNMGPSRTLILINGKRKNLSSLLYTQTSPGRGETGADISGIPVDAIERIEILRDGASAQYGSDAIAGVMNIILKDDVNDGAATLRTGITGKGDGEMLGVSYNDGSKIFDDAGFINYTIDFSKIAMANRPGTVDAQGEVDTFGADMNVVKNFLSRHPDAGNINASPETAAAKFELNGAVNIADNSKAYFNAAYVSKKVNSFANYRTPYWRPVAAYPYLADFFPAPGVPGNYDGYVPTFDGDLDDYNATLGIKTKKNDWNTDASITFGGNLQDYTVFNSHNRSNIQENGVNVYRENSPINFKPGGTVFSHVVGNIDISKVLSDKLSVGFGTEYRAEKFAIVEGDKASWDGSGADSFAGNRPENSGIFSRQNFGGYFDLAYDINKDFLINGTYRLENYSDFGSASVYKFSSRYKMFEDKFTLRASVSSGFRAPTLHQIYSQKSQYGFSGGIVQVSGLVSNVSPQAKLLGVKKLTAEKSNNFTAGFGFKPSKNFSFTTDFYLINIKDRIVLGNLIDTNGDNNGDVFFFSNAINTTTSGIDVVASYRNIELGNGKLNFNLAGNYTLQNEKTNATPKFLGQELIDKTQEHLLFTSRPETKWILGADYNIGKFGFSLNNTYFGKTTFQQDGIDDNLITEFIPKIVSDLGINYNATEKFSIAFNANNFLNVLPEWKFVALNSAGESVLQNPVAKQFNSNMITFSQRYSQMTYDGYHFSQLGAMFNLSFNYKF